MQKSFIVFVFFIFCGFSVLQASAARIDIPGGPGSFAFGSQLVLLPNGNFIVGDYGYDEGGVQDIGAVRLYNGATLALISTLKGSTQGDGVGGSQGITVLTGGNHFVVVSQSWGNGGTGQVGAVTLCSAVTGCSGTVTPANSLIGSTAVDVVGSTGVTPLTNGNYAVRSQNWHSTSPAASNAGAVTFCNASTNSCAGQVVSASNSIVGSTDADNIGGDNVPGNPSFSGKLIATLPNGNFFFRSPSWHNGPEAFAGAVTWCSGTAGCAGVLSSANSIVGTRAMDGVGFSPDTYGKTAPVVLTNGNFVVGTRTWDNTAAANSAGAATFCSGTTGCAGEISASNSLVGLNANDSVSYGGITALTSGDYVVSSHAWKNGTEAGAGAVTWCSGTTGCVGPITVDNSVLGGTANDNVGVVTALTNGNFVISSPAFGASDAGRVVFCSGQTGGPNLCEGSVPFPNFNGLDGSAFNGVGTNVLALANGNFVVGSPAWDNSKPLVVDAGAVTWCSGTSGCTGGAVTTFNSLTGDTPGTNVGNTNLPLALANGDYVIASTVWDNGGPADVGAVTFCNGTTNSCAGQIVSSANSLIGSTSGDFAGLVLSAFPNGNYVVRSEFWDGAAANVGAITYCNSTSNNCAGQVVSPSRSLVGSTSGDRIGGVGAGATTLTNGNLVIQSGQWNNGGSNPGAGAFTFCHATAGCPTGTLSAANSLTGTKTQDFGNVLGSGVLVQALTNGNYVVQSAIWDNGSAIDVGIVTWCRGTTGCTGAASASNSLVGSTSGDAAGGFAATVFPNGNYAVLASTWDIPPPGFLVNAGFATYGDGANGTFGIPNAPANSARTVVGTTNVGVSPPPRFDPVNNQMIISRTASNIVTVLTFTSTTPTPTATPTYTPTATFTATFTPTNTATATATATASPSCTPSEKVGDGTFEAGPPWPLWTVHTSTNFGTPLCNISGCGTGGGLAPPFAGNNWAWFGGSAPENATLGQNVTIPSGVTATLSFQMRIGTVTTPFTDTLMVTIDGTQVASFTEPSTPEQAYTLRTFDVSAFANGASHALLFTYTSPTTGSSSFVVDNVSLAAGCPTTPSIKGRLIYGNAAAPPVFISNAAVNGTGSPNVSTVTAPPGAAAGQYTLTGFGAGSYTVSLSKTTGQNGITSNDAGRIAQHVAATNVLTTNNQKVAADASGNGIISSFDAGQIAIFVASGPGAGTGTTGTWRFFVPPGPTFPVGGSQMTRTYASVTGNLTGEDYIGLLIGDVSGNWNNTGARAAGGGPERSIAVDLPTVVTPVDKEIIVPVSVHGVANKGVISYEFDLRYDPSVIQPLVDPVDLKDSVSRGLSVVANPTAPGLLRVVVYGAVPIDENGVLLDLRFTAIGKPGSVSPFLFERIMFNEGEPRVSAAAGHIELF